MCFKPKTKQINKCDRDHVNLKKIPPVTFVSTYAISYSSFTSVLYFCMNSHGAPSFNIQQEKRFNEATPRTKPSWPTVAVAVNQVHPSSPRIAVLALAGMGVPLSQCRQICAVLACSLGLQLWPGPGAKNERNISASIIIFI